MGLLTPLNTVGPDRRFLSEERARLIAYLHAHSVPPPVRRAGVAPRVWTVAALALIAAVVLGGSGIAYAAESALPGELLYSVKQASERFRVIVIRNPQRRAELLRRFEARRAAEAQAVKQKRMQLKRSERKQRSRENVRKE